MKIAEVESNEQRLLKKPPAQDAFIYELRLAYGTPKATIARPKQGTYNKATNNGEAHHYHLDLAVDRINQTNPSPPTKNAWCICLSCMKR